MAEPTFLKTSEWREVLTGNMTMGNETATERTNPILMTSTMREGAKAVRMFPSTLRKVT